MAEATRAATLVEMATDRRGQQSGRLAAYDRYLAQYFGPDAAGQGYGAAALDNYSDGRPALRAPGENASGRGGRASPNYIKPIVKDLVAVRGAWPTVTVPAASGDPADRERAVHITRALRQQHDHSAMVRQQQRAGFFLSCLGEVCYTLDPRTPQMARDDPNPFRPVGVYIGVVNPKEAFPRFQGDELVDLFIIRRVTRKEAREEFGSIAVSRGTEDSDRIDVIHYYSRTERQTLVDGRSAYAIVHDLGFCPAEWASNEETDGHWAQGDIAGTVELHEEVQDLWKVHVDSIIFSVYPIVHIHDEQNTQGQVAFGPGATFNTTGSGKIELLAPEANPQASAMIFEAALDNLLKQSGTAPIRIEGQIDRSNVSARSVDRQQAPMEQRLKLSMALLGQTLQRLNSKCLLMLSTVPELKKATMQLYGQDRDGTYNETFTGEEIGGWVRNTVTWDALTGTTQEQRALQALNLYKAGMQPDGSKLFPFEEVLTAANYDDPSEVMDRARSESATHATLPPGAPGPTPAGGAPSGPDQPGREQMSMAAGGPQGPGPGPAPGNGAPPQGMPAQPPPPQPGNGAAGAPGAPSVPNFPPVARHPGSPGRGTPAPVPDISGAVRMALAGLNLRGSANLVVRNDALVVEVSDHRDVPAVKAAVKPLEQQLGISISVKVSTGRNA